VNAVGVKLVCHFEGECENKVLRRILGPEGEVVDGSLKKLDNIIEYYNNQEGRGKG
jgi:hypothetical protein